MKEISSTYPNEIFKRSLHNRNDSGELAVFEAAMYFSGNNEPTDDDLLHYTHNYNNYTREERLGKGRISLDLPSSEQVHHHHDHHHKDHHVLDKHGDFNMKEKNSDVKHKQPNSPGGKIASFLNSLFHSKSKSKSTAKTRDEEESLSRGWRRRRRSSISHSNTTVNSSSKSLFSSSSFGFRTPPTKNYKEYYMNQMEEDKKKKKELMETLIEEQKVWSENDRRKRNGETETDGYESDSSSDLFELQNYELMSNTKKASTVLV